MTTKLYHIIKEGMHMRKFLILILIFIMIPITIAVAIEYPYPDLKIQQFDQYGRPLIDSKTKEYVYKPHYALTEITKLTKLGMIHGYPDGTFKPEDTMTRSEYIKMVITLATNRTFEFSNMPTKIENWSKAYVAVAEMQKVVGDGIYNDTNLEEPITRIEMACILANIQIKMKDVPQNRQGQLQYTDIDGLTEEEKELLLHAARYRLLSEDMLESTTFEPNKNITRAEAAISMIRIY